MLPIRKNMNAYAITLQLFEREYEDDPWVASKGDSKVRVITVAKSLEAAAKFAAEGLQKADQTEKDFDWQVVDACMIEGVVALPPFKTGLAPIT